MHQLFFDGSCNPNPGPTGLGAVLYGLNGEEVAVVCERGEDGTNNTAEYDSVIEGMKLALSKGIDELEVYGDSKLVINQILGKWECRQELLIPKLKLARGIASKFKSVSFGWVRREDNARADELSKLGAEKEPVRHNSTPAALPNYQIHPFPGVGFAVIEDGQLYAVNMKPLSCSCAGGTSCPHINYLKSLAANVA